MLFDYQGKTIYYESHGSGRPLLLLNGIMMSTGSWAPFVDALSRDNTRILLVDLMDQGRSAAFTAGYDIADQADMIAGLIEHLGLDKVNVMGTSYGGAVALSLAIRYPEMVDRLMLAATRAKTDALFRDMCESWLHACHSPQALYTATMPLFYGATFQEAQPAFLAKRRELLEKTLFKSPDFIERLKRLVHSILNFDLKDRLHEVHSPTLVLAPEEDLVMMPWEQKTIANGIKDAELLSLHKTGHVLFLERPHLFVPLIMGWFSHDDTVTLL